MGLSEGTVPGPPLSRSDLRKPHAPGLGGLLTAALLAAAAGAAAADGGDDRLRERIAMVEEQIAARGVVDPRVLAAMRAVPRHRFVPSGVGAAAYADSPLPIGEGQTISQPFIVAKMTELLALKATDKVFELGTGSGYQAAVASRLAARVFSVEIVPELASRAARTLGELHYDNVSVRAGDGYRGWPEEAPFDAILVTAAVPRLPDRLLAQLRPGGRAVMPVGDPGAVQELVLVEKDSAGALRTRTVFAVRFVPAIEGK
jgi:protein-L-isoaspartate(D-aspartate) O-methyltransferase